MTTERYIYLRGEDLQNVLDRANALSEFHKLVCVFVDPYVSPVYVAVLEKR